MTAVTQVSINQFNLIIKSEMIQPIREGEEVEVDPGLMILLTEERISIKVMVIQPSNMGERMVMQGKAKGEIHPCRLL